MSKREPGEKKQPSRRDEYITNRILIVFALAFAGIIGLMVVNYFYPRMGSMVTTYYTLNVLMWLGAAAFVVGLVMEFVTLRNPPESKMHIFRGINIAVLGAIVGGSCLYMVLDMAAVQQLYLLVPVLAILYLVYFIYQREFFFVASVSVLGCFTCWALSKLLGNGGYVGLPYVVGGLCAAVLIAVVVVALIFRARGGRVKVAGREIAFFKPGARYTAIYIACAVIAACIIASFIFGAFIAYCAFFVVAGLLFIFAVYFTVKLM